MRVLEQDVDHVIEHGIARFGMAAASEIRATESFDAASEHRLVEGAPLFLK